jgi:hypothetical protein
MSRISRVVIEDDGTIERIEEELAADQEGGEEPDLKGPVERGGLSLAGTRSPAAASR